jgi:excisionase family DNA binding protein
MSVKKLEKGISWSSFDQDLLNISEVAEILRLSKFTVRLFIGRGELTTVRLGRRVLIYRDDLRKFIEERRGVENPRQKLMDRGLI